MEKEPILFDKRLFAFLRAGFSHTLFHALSQVLLRRDPTSRYPTSRYPTSRNLPSRDLPSCDLPSYFPSLCATAWPRRRPPRHT
jgi:hypothetical protein